MQDRTDSGQGCPSRRRFSAGALALLAAGGLAPARARAAEYPAGEPRCATCDFWGGAREIAAGGKAVTVAEGVTGQCNNQKSPLYQKQTKPTQLFKAGYVRWKQLA